MIYFDGYLPPSKLDIRTERLQYQTKRLNGYYHTNQIPHKASSTKGNTSPSIAGRDFAAIFPPPLLVPAVMDALNSTDRYSNITMTVPGEADSYCARYLEQHGGIVLTGDSDLLLYNLGSEGAVCFFNDIVTTSATESDCLIHIFRPSAIADRLALPKTHGLHALAFEILMDTSGTFRKLLTQAVSLKAIQENEDKYRYFCQEYSMPISDLSKEMVSGIEEGPELLQALRNLDPRISEFVLQFQDLSRLAGHDFPISSSPHVFLPFLVDCPVRTNAWEISTPMRQLAYGLINLIVPENQRRLSMFESRRQQNESAGREWQLPSPSEIPKACSELVALFDQLSAKFHDLSFLEIWTAWAVYQKVEHSFSHGKPDLIDLVIQQLFDVGDTLATSSSLSWDVIHFFAQVEGSYYSLRILRQITSLVVLHSQKKTLPSSISTLHHRLKTLPCLNSWHGLYGPCSEGQMQELKRMLKVAHEIIGFDSHKSVEIPQALPGHFQKKRKKNNAQNPIANPKPNNPFGVLQLD